MTKSITSPTNTYIKNWQEYNAFFAMVFTKISLAYYWYLLSLRKTYHAIYRLSINWEETESISKSEYQEFFPDYEILNDSSVKISAKKIKHFVSRFRGTHIELKFKNIDFKTKRYNELAHEEASEFAKFCSTNEEMSKEIKNIDGTVVFYIQQILAKEKELHASTKIHT